MTNQNVAGALRSAIAQQVQGHLAAAEQLYVQILQAQPVTEAMVLLASVKFLTGNREEAFQLISQALEDNAGSAQAYAQRDRMMYVIQREANHSANADLELMRGSFAAMESELCRKDIYVPSQFWDKWGKVQKHLLEIYGVENFKRTVAHQYQNWLMVKQEDPQVQRLVELWPTHLRFTALRKFHRKTG